MADINLLTVNGVAVKNPSSYDIQYADLDSENSYTSMTGVLNRDMIRANQRTLSVSWNKLTLSELSFLLQTCTGNASVTLRFLDFYSGAFATGTFYPDNRQGNAKRVRTLSNGLFSLTFNFIEF